jgi:hypothetical protein
MCNIDNANQNFGADLANLRGKTTRTKPDHVQVKCIIIPRVCVQLHKYISLKAYVMFVNGLPFMVNSAQSTS